MLESQEELNRIIKEFKKIIPDDFMPHNLFTELEDEFRKLNHTLESANFAIEVMEKRERKNEIKYEAMKMCSDNLLKLIGDRMDRK